MIQLPWKTIFDSFIKCYPIYFPYYPDILLLSDLLKKTEIKCLHKDLLGVDSSSIHNSQKLEATQMSTTW